MTPLTTVSGPAVPLMASNVNTDVIIRIERLTLVARDQLGPYAFEAWRTRPDGSPDPDFVLNQPAWRNAPILYSCSSRRRRPARTTSLALLKRPLSICMLMNPSKWSPRLMLVFLAVMAPLAGPSRGTPNSRARRPSRSG